MADTTLSTLHASAKTAVPAGAGILISLPGGSGRVFDELAPSALTGSLISIDGSTIVASMSSPYQMQTSDRVVNVNKATGAATKILLPINPTFGIEYTIIDGKGDAKTNNILVMLAGTGLIGGTAGLLSQVNQDVMTFRAVNATTWLITSRICS